MEWKKRKMMGVLGLMLAATLMLCSTASAENAAPGEGFYVGAFIGHGTGIVQAKSTVLDADNGNDASAVSPTTFETDRGGLGLSGIQGGGWLGWGLKTADDLYFGFEISAAGDRKSTR